MPIKKIEPEMVWEAPKGEEIVSVTQIMNDDLLIHTKDKVYIVRN